MILGLVSDTEKITRKAEISFDKKVSYEPAWKREIMSDFYVIASNNIHRIQQFNWGLVPFWSKVKSQHFYAMVKGDEKGLRIKNLLNDSVFRLPIREKRCIIPVDYFIIEANDGRRFLVHQAQSDRPFALGGVWDAWKSNMGDDLQYTFCPIMVPAPKKFQDIGVDMFPLVFYNFSKRWLNPNLHLVGVTEMITTADHKFFNAYPVNVYKQEKEITNPIGPKIFYEHKPNFNMLRRKTKPDDNNKPVITLADRVNGNNNK